MNGLLYVLGLIAFLLGSLFLVEAKGAIQENTGLIVILIGTVFFSSGAIVSALNRICVNVATRAKEVDQ